MLRRESQKGESVRYSLQTGRRYSSIVMIGGRVVMQEHYDPVACWWTFRCWDGGMEYHEPQLPEASPGTYAA